MKLLMNRIINLQALIIKIKHFIHFQLQNNLYIFVIFRNYVNLISNAYENKCCLFIFCVDYKFDIFKVSYHFYFLMY